MLTLYCAPFNLTGSPIGTGFSTTAWINGVYGTVAGMELFSVQAPCLVDFKSIQKVGISWRQGNIAAKTPIAA